MLPERVWVLPGSSIQCLHSGFPSREITTAETSVQHMCISAGSLAPAGLVSSRFSPSARAASAVISHKEANFPSGIPNSNSTLQDQQEG
jgi:hypothetical protein